MIAGEDITRGPRKLRDIPQRSGCLEKESEDAPRGVAGGPIPRDKGKVRGGQLKSS